MRCWAFFSLLCIGLGLSFFSLLTGSIKVTQGQLVGILRWEVDCLLSPSIDVEQARHNAIQDPEAFEALHGFSYKQALVVRELRLPRYLFAGLAGAGLALAGACLQGLFRNPLADPSLIGVSAGASLGTVGLMVIGSDWINTLEYPWSELATFSAAFLSGLIITYFIYLISRNRQGQVSIALMLLGGVAITTFSSSLISCLIYFSHDTELRRFTYWSLGSLTGANWKTLMLVTPLLVPGILGLLLCAKSLNALALGESEAQHLGINTHSITRLIVLLCSLVVGVIISVCGVISFVGLIVPHCIRLIIGPNHKTLLPASLLLGAIIMIYSDWAARALPAEQVLPSGLITALMGAPFFLLLLYRERSRF